MTPLNNDSNLPRHIAIIMDGNGRWATKHKLPRVEGHRRGANTVRHMAEACIEFGISYLTLYVFSTENWNRPEREVKDLFTILLENLDKGLSTAMEMGVRIYHLGKMEGLPKKIQQKITEAMELTKKNKKLNLVLAFNYGGRDELVNAIRRILEKGLQANNINESTISSHLYSAGIPDPDLIIRTGGEMRLSNFLLWQAAYAEIYFTDALWPDFNKAELMKAIDVYSKRQRRFGGLSSNDVKS